MSKNRQNQQQALADAARKNRERADQAKANASNEGKEEEVLESFVDKAAIDQRSVEEARQVEKGSDVEVEDLPSHVEEARANEAVSTTVDIDKVRSEVSTAGNLVIDAILKYMEDTKPNKPLSLKEGARHVSAFWSALKVMFNRLDDSDFPKVFRMLLDLFEEHKEGVFRDEMVYRFAEEWPMPESERLAYRRLINMILVTRQASTRRQALKQMKNWDYTLEYGLTPQARARIENFYDL